jgi:outer membrane protein assembly factor BamD
MIRLNKFIKNILICWALLAFCVIYAGCASTKKKDIYERTPADLLAEGQEKLDASEFKSATKLLQAIKDRYPYSKESLKAELLLADSLFQRQDYETALSNYDEFEKLHPKEKNIPYVIYQKGLCHFLQITTIDRDQAAITKARDEFEKLVRRFPDNEYSSKAKEYIRECIVKQSEYELYVGHFYYKMGKYEPAMTRFKYLIENYPDVGQYHEALEYIAKCENKLAEAKK